MSMKQERGGTAPQVWPAGRRTGRLRLRELSEWERALRASGGGAA